MKTRFSPCGFLSKGVITWRISFRGEISARPTGLTFQAGFWKKSSWNESGDHMEVSARAENPSPFFETRLGFSARAENAHPGMEGWKPHVIAAKFQPGLKREFALAHWRNIQRNQMATMEKLFLNPGWNLPWYRNKLSARGAGLNFSPGWNSPCNHPLNTAFFYYYYIPQ